MTSFMIAGALIMIIVTLMAVVFRRETTPHKRARITPHYPEEEARELAENSKTHRRGTRTRMIRRTGDLPAPRNGLHTRNHVKCRACKNRLDDMMNVPKKERGDFGL